MTQLQLIRQLTSAKLNVAASAAEISASGCIEAIDSFNNSADTLDAFGTFLRPGPTIHGLAAKLAKTAL